MRGSGSPWLPFAAVCELSKQGVVNEYFGEVMAQTCSHVTEWTAFRVMHQSWSAVLPYTLNMGYTSISSHMADTHLMNSLSLWKGTSAVWIHPEHQYEAHRTMSTHIPKEYAFGGRILGILTGNWENKSLYVCVGFQFFWYIKVVKLFKLVCTSRIVQTFKITNLFFWTCVVQKAHSLIGNGLSYSKENSNHWTWFFDLQEPIFQQFVLNWFSFVDEAK